jgi:hypothetical protein
MAKNHGVSKRNRRQVSGKRPDTKLIARNMAIIKALEKRDRILAEEGIDTTDIPEITDWSGAVRGKFYRPDTTNAVRGPSVMFIVFDEFINGA